MFIGEALNLLPLVALEVFLVFVAVRRRLLLSSLVATQAVMFLGGAAVALTFRDPSILLPMALVGILGVGSTAAIQSRVTPVPAPTLPPAALRPALIEDLQRRLVDVGRALETGHPSGGCHF